MAKIDQEIDRLYQVPLGEFTTARNELAKRAGADRAAVNRQQKPNIAAWVVNQLYWRERKTYEALVAAAERLRSSHAAALTGKHSDLSRAETAHAETLRAAADRVRQILRDAGEKASPATMNAVHETLQALPSPEAPGRLTRPLKPLGFEALAGLLAGGTNVKRAATVLAFKEQLSNAPRGERAPTAKQAAAAAKREEEAARRESQARTKAAEKLSAELRQARGAERGAGAALSKVRANLAKATQDVEQLTARLRQAEAGVEKLSDEFRQRERAASTAEFRRRDIETRLKALQNHS